MKTMSSKPIECIDIALIVDNKPVRLELDKLDIDKLVFNFNGVGIGLSESYLNELKRIHSIIDKVIDFDTKICSLWLECPINECDKIVIVTKDNEINLSDFVDLRFINKINNSDKITEKLVFRRTVNEERYDWKYEVLSVDFEKQTIRLSIG